MALLATTPARLAEIAPDDNWTPLASDEIAPRSLGCNGEAGEYYVLFATGSIGVFGRRGVISRRRPTLVPPPVLACGATHLSFYVA